jgi:hypothetical protein
MKNREVTLPCARILKWPHIIPQLIIYRQRKEIRPMTSFPQQIADMTGAVPDGVAPMSRRHPLIDDQVSSVVFSYQ